MKEKKKIILQAILISVIVTSIFLITSYISIYAYLHPSVPGSQNLTNPSVENPLLHLYIPYLIGGLLVVFPLVTLISSFIIIHLRIKKK